MLHFVGQKEYINRYTAMWHINNIIYDEIGETNTVIRNETSEQSSDL